MTVSLWKDNPNQLLIYLKEVHVYIGFWTLGWSALKMDYMHKQPLRMQGSCQGRGPRLCFFGVAPARRPNACNARREHLERPIVHLVCKMDNSNRWSTFKHHEYLSCSFTSPIAWNLGIPFARGPFLGWSPWGIMLWFGMHQQ